MDLAENRPSRRRAVRIPALLGAGVLIVVLMAPAVGAAVAPQDLPRPQRSAGEIRDVAHDVLARPDLRPPVKTIQERIVDYVLRQISRALEALAGGGRGALVGWVIVVAALLALLYFVARFAMGMGGDGRRRPAGIDEPLRPAADWRAEADRYEARREWKAALRCRYRALVADLAARGLVEEIPGRTAGEYRSEVRRSLPDAAGEFGSATDLFEWAWYGDRPTGEVDNRRFRSLADDVLTRAG